MDKLIHLILLSGLVFIPGSLEENLALKGTATQSSTILQSGIPLVAQKAIDGVRYASGVAASCAHTSDDSSSWWRLDLLDIYNITTVIITTRSDAYFFQTNGAEIRIGNSLDNNGNNNPRCAVTSGFQNGYTISYSCNGMEGRYVNVAKTGSHLTLCEVEVYGTENLAFKGTATQSSTHKTWTALHAIDGVRHGPDPDDVTYCSCTSYESDPWWRLDLQDIYEINTVIITARSDGCVDQTNGAEIRIGDSLDNNGNNNTICAVTSDILDGQTISYSCHGMEGRYVNVVMTGRSFYLALCELEVYGKLPMRRTFLRLKFSSSGDVAADSDKILHQLQSVLGSNISDFKLSWTQPPQKEEEEHEEDGGSCVKHH